MYFLEYIWLDKEGFTRSKVRTCWKAIDKYKGLTPEDLPTWNFDGSSTGQNIGKDTEVVLKPVRVYQSPFEEDHFLVLCELDLEYKKYAEVLEKGPIRGFNTRYWAGRVADKCADLEPWFGLEQEYTLIDPKTDLPYHWDEFGRQGQGNYYCSVRYPYCQLNELVREHCKACAKIGIKINGFNAEVLPSQWEFQVGPDDLLKIADDLVMARYLLFRLSAKYGVKITFEPKPMKGEWNGSGCHLNFSTNKMRETVDGSGMKEIDQVIKNLSQNHLKILEYYGDNTERLTGEHETSSPKDFTHGIGTRNTSIRVPNHVVVEGGGYIEDRRPASNIDPYLAMGKFLENAVSFFNG